MYRLKIGTEEFLKEIQNTEDWAQTIVRDFNDRIYRVRGDYRFKGWQGLYSLLYTNMVANGICNSLTGSIYFRGDAAQAFEKVWRGDIKPQDFEFDLINYSADGQILDASWSARIKDASEQEVSLRRGIGKNGQRITKCPFVDTRFFDPTDGNYYAGSYITFRVFEVFKYLVAYHCGDDVTFASDYFTYGVDGAGDGEQYCITHGRALRQGGLTHDLEVSFAELFDELNKKLNLWIIVEGTYDAPVIRIEPQSYIFQESQAYQINNPESVVTRVVLDRLYTKVTVGGDSADYAPANNATYAERPYKDWREVEYATVGDCGFENRELNLVSTWKIDNNSIHQALEADDDESYDDDIFIVEIDQNGFAIKFTSEVTQGNADLDSFYNFNLNNEETIIRWFGQLPEPTTEPYHIRGTQPYFDQVFSGNTSQRVRWQTTQGADPFNIFITVSEEPVDYGYFVSPVTGVYTFDVAMEIAIISSSSIVLPFFSGRVDLIVETADATPVEIERITLQEWPTPIFAPLPSGGILYFNREVQAVVQANNRAKVELVWYSGAAQIRVAGYFDITGGKVLFDFGDAFDYRFEYDIQQFALPVSGFDDIKASRGFVRFVDDATGRAWDVWPSEMMYSHERQVVTTGKFVGRSPLNINTDLCWVLDGEYGLGYWDSSCYWINSRTWTNPKF